MENMSELADQQMGGGSDVEAGAESVSVGSCARSPSNAGVPSVDAVEPVDSVGSVASGVDPPELLPAHEIASEIAASDSPVNTTHSHDTTSDQDSTSHSRRRHQQQQNEHEHDASEIDAAPLDDDEDDEQDSQPVMIDSSDFRGVLSEPTYQTLNGRMTPPGFPTSSSYATLTPLQPLPPISTMSDKFSHHYGHHTGNGGFALMQNVNVSMGGMAGYTQYDKLGSAMAAAGMNMTVNMGQVNVSLGQPHSGHIGHVSNANSQHLMNSHHHHHHHVAGLNVVNASGQSVIPSPPYNSNGLHSPDKSMSPSNGYDYSREQRVLGSPQSPSSVNLHSPNSFNGLPATPPSAQMPPSPPTQQQQQQHHACAAQMAAISMQNNPPHTAHLTYVTTSGHDVKVATTLTAPQPVTVLQAVTPCPTPAAIAPSAQTVTIVQAASAAAAVSNLATTIMSTPVAVVTTAQQQLALQQQALQHHQQHQHIISNQNNSIAKQATGDSTNNSNNNQRSSNNNNKICLNSQPSSASSAVSGDESEEINTKELAQRISAELKRYSIPQAIFAQRVLCRSQGTLSDLLRNPKPWSKLKSGRETFRRMSKWLEEPEFQRMSALRLAGQSTTAVNHVVQQYNPINGHFTSVPLAPPGLSLERPDAMRCQRICLFFLSLPYQFLSYKFIFKFSCCSINSLLGIIIFHCVSL